MGKAEIHVQTSSWKIRLSNHFKRAIALYLWYAPLKIRQAERRPYERETYAWRHSRFDVSFVRLLEAAYWRSFWNLKQMLWCDEKESSKKLWKGKRETSDCRNNGRRKSFAVAKILRHELQCIFGKTPRKQTDVLLDGARRFGVYPPFQSWNTIRLRRNQRRRKRKTVHDRCSQNRMYVLYVRAALRKEGWNQIRQNEANTP